MKHLILTMINILVRNVLLYGTKRPDLHVQVGRNDPERNDPHS
jgi:hypothetical protein